MYDGNLLSDSWGLVYEVVQDDLGDTDPLDSPIDTIVERPAIDLMMCRLGSAEVVVILRE